MARSEFLPRVNLFVPLFEILFSSVQHYVVVAIGAIRSLNLDYDASFLIII